MNCRILPQVRKNPRVPTRPWSNSKSALSPRSLSFIRFPSYEKRRGDDLTYSAVIVDAPLEYMLVSHFIARLFPVGHIKSTEPRDQKFLDHFKQSKKWLRLREAGVGVHSLGK